MGRSEHDVGFRGNFQRICAQLVDNYKMRLTRIIPVGGKQIHMIIQGESRRKESAMAKGEETIRGIHFRNFIGIIKGREIAPSVKKWGR